MQVLMSWRAVTKVHMCLLLLCLWHPAFPVPVMLSFFFFLTLPLLTLVLLVIFRLRNTAATNYHFIIVRNTFLLI